MKNRYYVTGFIITLILIPVLALIQGCKTGIKSDTTSDSEKEVEYFTAENREAVQAISYGFRLWYEDENKLPGGVIIVEPSGDTTGVTDLKILQQAVDSMTNAGGGKVQLVKGTYIVNNAVMIKSNVIMRGAGREKTKMKNVRKTGAPQSWDVIKMGIHHPNIMTKGRVDAYHKVKFGSEEAGSRKFTVIEGTFDDFVLTNQNNREYWDKYKPEVGDMVLIADYEHGRDGQGYPWPATHHWGQFARIIAIDGYTVTLDEPHVMGKESGLACWIPKPPPFDHASNLHYCWVDNCVIGDMEYENVSAMMMGQVGVRNGLIENINVIKTRGGRRGVQIQGFYKSTIQGCYIEFAGGRTLEIKHASGRVLIRDNKFVCVGALSERPSISLGESVYAIHIHENEWHYMVSPHPGTWTFCMPQQYGGSFRRNYIHCDEGAQFPASASMFQIKGGYPKYTYMDSTYQLYRNTGYMVWEGNRYELTIGIAYDFWSTDIEKTDRYWMRGALIKDEDWTGSVITRSNGGSIQHGHPSRPEDVVIVENVKNLMGQEVAWLAVDSATSFPRLIADRDDPAQIVSVTTDADLATNPLINDPLVRVDGMIVRIEGVRYTWNESGKYWENLDGGADITPVN